MLYKIGKHLEYIEENTFKLEKEIQNVFEDNIEEITGFILVKSEFSIKGKRFDTLAFDTESKAFVVIEYKRDKSFSVIDQGFTYLGLALENKADLVLEYNEILKKSLKRDEVDWSQTRVIFVSSEFTENQISASNFKDLAIDLYELRRYKNDTLFINKIKKSKSAESIKPIVKNNEKFEKIAIEIIKYSEEYHLSFAGNKIKELYEKFRQSILNLADGIEVDDTLKTYIAFKKNNKNIADILIQKSSLKLFINAKYPNIKDVNNIARNVANIGHFGNGDYEIYIEDDKHLEYIMSLIKQII